MPYVVVELERRSKSGKLGNTLRNAAALIWRARVLWLGLIAIDLALRGQVLLARQNNLAIVPATRWYTLSIIPLII